MEIMWFYVSHCKKKITLYEGKEPKVPGFWKNLTSLKTWVVKLEFMKELWEGKRENVK